MVDHSGKPRTRSKAANAAANTILMLMIGDGVLALLAPKEHAKLWRVGPKWFRDFMYWFERHPEWTRVVASLEVGLGISLAMSQYRREQKDPSRDEAEASTPPIDRKSSQRKGP